MSELLQNAANSITFIQNEHKKMLAGLHKEIEQLQQKCSDLQFQLSSYSKLNNQTQESNRKIDQLQKEAVKREALIKDLSNKLSQSLDRVQSLEEELRWKDIEFQNQVKSKDSKIVELRQNLAVNGEVSRLKDECNKLYDQTRVSARRRIEHVSDLARRATITELHPSDKSGSVTNKKFQQNGNEVKLWRSMDSNPPISMDSKSSVESRSKVFRHKLQKIYSLDIKDWSIDSTADSDRSSDGATQQSLMLYSFENPPASIPMTGYQRQSHSSLPVSSSRFPPIVPNNNQYPSREDSQEIMDCLSLSESMSSLTSGFESSIIQQPEDGHR